MMPLNLLIHIMRIKIDNIEVEAEDGITILDAARLAGIDIPTLCHNDGVEPYSSCMVCMVRDKAKNNFVPSCSALAHDSMDIDASGEEVLSLRKKAVTLLLSEHRAECEARCRAVCPAGYNIPLMNRQLVAGEYEEAAELIRSEIGNGELNCISCKAFCENACLRRKIDSPISIRNIRIFISNNLPAVRKYEVSPLFSAKGVRDRYSSRTGPLEEKELAEWTRECQENPVRHRDISGFDMAAEEAAACMHCDCRASSDCRLRELADKFGLKDPKGKFVNAPIRKKISRKTGLIFENSKCIKCGLCVRIVADSAENPALCFINRGFVSLLSEPLTAEFDDITAAVAEKCVEVCPTGALAFLKN